MQELLEAIDRWIAENKPIALATVIKTWGSSPRGVGSKMVVNGDSEMAGSVSGGCVEGAVVAVGMEVLKTGSPQWLHFGVADETAWDVGLACGGEIEVFVRKLDLSTYEFLRQKWEIGLRVANAVFIEGPEEVLGCDLALAEDDTRTASIALSHNNTLENLAFESLKSGETGRKNLGWYETQKIEIFVDVVLPPPTLVIIGGVHIAISLVTLANTLSFRTVVIDPRRKFASQERFAHAGQVINAWPAAAFSQIKLHSSTAIVMLTHDPKIDDPALEIALPSPAFYVGALGSQKTQSHRRERLLEMGLRPDQIDRLHGPIGLNLGGRSPEEIALAIMAEIVLVRSG